MTTSLILSFLWVLASAFTAMLPMRLQFVPGLSLLVLCVPLLVFVGYENGWWIAAIAFLAAASMFRHPLKYFVRRALGMPVSLPKELQERNK